MIRRFLSRLIPEIPVVIDPVLSATAGGNLITESSLEKIREVYLSDLLPFANVVTPNLQEARFLINYSDDLFDPEEIAISLLDISGADSVIITGVEKKPGKLTDIIVNRNSDSRSNTEWEHQMIECENLHGTGCAYSSILACRLALGEPIHKAFIRTAIDMQSIISDSCSYRLGNSSYGPLNVNGYKLKRQKE